MKMTEVSKQYKIILIINIVVSMAYAIPYMFISKLWLPFVEYLNATPFYPQALGVTLFVIAVWSLRVILQKKDWESISFFMEFIFVFLFGLIIYMVLEQWFYLTPRSVHPVAWVNNIISLCVVGALFAANMVFYFLETAKHN